MHDSRQSLVATRMNYIKRKVRPKSATNRILYVGLPDQIIGNLTAGMKTKENQNQLYASFDFHCTTLRN